MHRFELLWYPESSQNGYKNSFGIHFHKYFPWKCNVDGTIFWLERSRDMRMLTAAMVIPIEQCVLQHKLLLWSAENNKIGEGVERKRCLFLMWKNSEPGEEKTNEEACTWRKANKQVKRIIYKSKDDYRQELVEEFEREETKENVFNVVKRMTSMNK